MNVSAIHSDNTRKKKKRCTLWIAKYICHWGGRRSQIQNSFNLVNNSVNPSLWEMMNSTSSSGKNIKTPASMLSCEHNRKRFRTKIHFPPRRVPSLSSKQYFSKVKCRQIAVHPAATLKGLKVFIIVIVRQVWGQADLKHGLDYNLYCDGIFFFPILWQKQGQQQYYYQVKCRKVPAWSSIQYDNSQGAVDDLTLCQAQTEVIKKNSGLLTIVPKNVYRCTTRD